MRWFLILAVATVAVALVDAAPAKAQIVIGGYQIGGYPAFTPRYYVPYTPYSPYTRVVTPVGTEVIPSNGGPVDFALNSALRPLGSIGYGPYAPYYGYPANYSPWNAYRPYNALPSNWRLVEPKWVEPRTVNPGLHKGWYKGGKGK